MVLQIVGTLAPVAQKNPIGQGDGGDVAPKTEQKNPAVHGNCTMGVGQK
jgi:hypothetical protein